MEAPEETARNYKVYNHFYHLDQDEHSINFIDTPGNTDFLPKIKTALFATDASVFVVFGEGLDGTFFRIWEAISDNNKARFIFVNKMDVKESDFDQTLELI